MEGKGYTIKDIENQLVVKDIAVTALGSIVDPPLGEGNYHEKRILKVTKKS
jgi:hypothetical protein